MGIDSCLPMHGGLIHLLIDVINICYLLVIPMRLLLLRYPMKLLIEILGNLLLIGISFKRNLLLHFTLLMLLIILLALIQLILQQCNDISNIQSFLHVYDFICVYSAKKNGMCIF